MNASISLNSSPQQPTHIQSPTSLTAMSEETLPRWRRDQVTKGKYEINASASPNSSTHQARPGNKRKNTISTLPPRRTPRHTTSHRLIDVATRAIVKVGLQPGDLILTR